ncbi:MAG: DUF4252 domain-containing protein [Acidobacteria bacterium]|nr:DUF4252 domain-containing protein [Acidobacteriota bacterium]
MKAIFPKLPGLLFVVLPLLAVNAATAYAQDAKLRIDHLNKLSDKAVQIIDVNMGESIIQLAASMLNEKRSPDEAKIKELIKGIQGVFVKRFEFDKEGEFTDSDIAPIRSQLHDNPAWERIVSVISRKKGGDKMNVEVFLMSQGTVVKGLAVLATEAKAITVVNLVGPVDLQKLSELEGKFGIPKLGLKQTEQPDDAEKKEKPEPKKP